jgi:hypothetical protein
LVGAALAAGACSAPQLEAVPAFAQCEPESLLPGAPTTLELGHMSGGAFVPATAGDEIEIAPWAESARWYAMVAARLTLPLDGGPSVCARILPSLTWDRLHGPTGIVMSRDASGPGVYVAPAVPIDVPLQLSSQLWAALGKPRTFSAFADASAGGQRFSGESQPVDLVPVNRVGFLSLSPPGRPDSGADGAPGMGTPVFALRVGVPGATSILAPQGRATEVHLEVTGQRAGWPVELSLLSVLPAGVELGLSRTTIPANASDADAAVTTALLQVPTTVAVGTQFDLRVLATAGSVSVTDVTSVTIVPAPENP